MLRWRKAHFKIDYFSVFLIWKYFGHYLVQFSRRIKIGSPMMNCAYFIMVKKKKFVLLFFINNQHQLLPPPPSHERNQITIWWLLYLSLILTFKKLSSLTSWSQNFNPFRDCRVRVIKPPCPLQTKKYNSLPLSSTRIHSDESTRPHRHFPLLSML